MTCIRRASGASKTGVRSVILATNAIAILLATPALTQQTGECKQRLAQIELLVAQAHLESDRQQDINDVIEGARTLAESDDVEGCMRVVVELEDLMQTVEQTQSQAGGQQQQGQQQAQTGQQQGQQGQQQAEQALQQVAQQVEQQVQQAQQALQQAMQQQGEEGQQAATAEAEMEVKQPQPQVTVRQQAPQAAVSVPSGEQQSEQLPAATASLRITRSVYDYIHGSGEEDPGYGLYTYVLVPYNTHRAMVLFRGIFERTQHAIDAKTARERLNMLYLPVRKTPDRRPPKVEEFLKNEYDFDFANNFLDRICGDPADVVKDTCSEARSLGPYLFTYTDPASNLTALPPPYLFLDLSYIHTEAFYEVLRFYKKQVKRTDFSRIERLERLRIDLLNWSLQTADLFEPTLDAISKFINMARGEE